MEIKAKCTYDYESMKALAHTTMYRIIKPKAAFILMMSFCIVTAFLIIIPGIIWWDIGMISIDLLILVVILMLVYAFLYFGVPKMNYNAMGKMKNIRNEYIFLEDSIKILSKSEEYSAEGEVKYSMLYKVMETSKYIFILQNKRQAFVVDKSTITNEEMKAIREKLTLFVKKKYIIYKY